MGGSGKPPPDVPLLAFISRGKPRSHESSFSPFFADYIFGSEIMESSEMKVSRWFHHSCIECSTSLRVIPSLPPGAKKPAIFLLCLLERKCNLTDILESLRRSKIVPGDINRQQHCCLLAVSYLVSVPRWFLPFIWFLFRFSYHICSLSCFCLDVLPSAFPILSLPSLFTPTYAPTFWQICFNLAHETWQRLWSEACRGMTQTDVVSAW